MVIIAMMWARRCGGSARYGAHAPADRRTDTSTTPAPGDRANDSPGAGADQAAPQRSLGGIVGVRECGGRQHQPSANRAGDTQPLSHLLDFQMLESERMTGACSSGLWCSFLVIENLVAGGFTDADRPKLTGSGT